MKITSRIVTWEQEPWVIVVVQESGRRSYQALNIKTGQKEQLRDSYEEAFKDIPISKHAEPWGV